MENWVNLLKVVIQHGATSDETFRFISYRESSIKLNQSRYDYIMSNLPEKWSSDVEKIIRFDVRLEQNSGEIKYYIEVEKHAYDFRLRETRRTTTVRTPNNEECEELYKKFTDYYNKFFIEQYENLYDEILSSITNNSFVSLKLIEMRNLLLKESDIYMLPDFPISEEDRAKITEYRQKLRDLTDQEGWPNNLETIEMPVSPVDQQIQLQIMNDYLFDPNMMDTRLKNLGADILASNSEEGIKSYMTIVMKMNILSSLYNLKIPMFVEQNNGSFEEIMESAKESYESFSRYTTVEYINASDDEESTSKFQQAMDDLNSKISMVNETIQNYNLNFTVGDIIKDLITQKEIELEAEEIVNNLDLDTENTEV